jgi:hypothetical protein
MQSCCDQGFVYEGIKTHALSRLLMVSPAERACENVFQVAFGFCMLVDLHHLAAVSRYCQRIVDMMPRLGASIVVRSLVPSAPGSRLWRHVSSYAGPVEWKFLPQDITNLTSIDCHDEVSPAYLVMLRNAVNLQHIRFCGDHVMTAVSMATLVAPSAQQLLSVNWICPDNTPADSPGSLPTLTKLDLQRAFRLTRIDWLASLARLTDLAIDFSCNGNWENQMTPEALVRGLRAVPGLTRLHLNEPSIETSHLARILSGLPFLRTFHLIRVPHVESLSFLSATSPHLTHLVLDTCDYDDLDATEVMHIVAHCRSLSRLELTHLFANHLPASVRALFEPPSKLMPCLKQLLWGDW